MSRAARPVLTALAVALAAPLLAPLACAKRSAAPPRVLLVGLDGLDLAIVSRLAAAGTLPTFARLLREGAHGGLRSMEPLLSPLVWTTIATGRRPEDHGVLDFVEIAADGQPMPVTSTRRKVPALWNVASEFGKSSGFIGWYASYPAETVDGFVVSDRLAFHQVKSARAVAGATYPESLREELARSVGEPVPDVAATKRRFLPDPSAPLSADGERRVAELAKIHATSELYRRALPDLARRFRPELLAVYFEGIDAAGHLFMEDAPPRRADVTDQDFTAFSEVVDRYYAYQDEVLADLLKLAGPRTVTLVVSDHGFKSGDARPRTSGRADTGLAPLWHRLYGTVLALGDGVKPGAEIAGASVLDVAPTVLALLDVPLSKELPGRPIDSAFAAPPRTASVERYAAPARRAAPRVTSDPETVQKLLALGYLTGAGARKIAHDAEGRTAASFLNEGAARVAAGDEDGALRAFGRAIDLDPENAFALVYAARISDRRRQYARGGELLDRALAARPQDAFVRLQRAAHALAVGDLLAAEAEVAAAARLDDRLPLFHYVKARLLDRQGSPEAALKELEQAESLTDSDGLLAEILVKRAEVAAALGRVPEAEAAATRAGRYAPADRLAAVMGDIAVARRDPEAAARLYATAVRARPDDPHVEIQLAKALAVTGRLDDAEGALRNAQRKAGTDAEKEEAWGELSTFYQLRGQERRARETLLEATRALPRSNVLWALLGASYGRAGEHGQALLAYERSVALQPTALACKTLAALVFEERHDRERAVRLWRQSLALEPGQPDVQAFLARYAGGR